MPIEPGDVAICVADDGVAAEHGPVPMSPPITQTSLFAFPTFQALLDGLSREDRTHVYTRGRNPTVEEVERKLAALERGGACKCFASGMAAISAVLLGILRSGDHILFVNQTYGPALQLADHLGRFGIEHDQLLDTDVAAVQRALRPNTRLVWLESPGTMLFRMLDIAAIAGLAQDHGALVCMDNSWATPLFQKPLTLGADIVVHSASKYLGGHSDVMAGAVVTNPALMEDIFFRAFMLNGGILAPFDAWLLLRGIRTLPARMRQHEADGLRVATFLREHPAVRRVYHPAYAEEADRVGGQLGGYSGLLAFELKRGAFENVRRVIDALDRFRIGVSWGGIESLALSPNRGSNGAWLDAQRIPRGLIRLSIGLEGAELLIEDLATALEAVQ